jgi:hypothetical protein
MPSVVFVRHRAGVASTLGLVRLLVLVSGALAMNGRSFSRFVGRSSKPSSSVPSP